MGVLGQTFEERFQEIEAYLDLLDGLELQVRLGPRPPKIGSFSVTTQQLKILYSSVYLQLYNLVEATVTWCVDAVCKAAAEDGRWLPGDLSMQLRREWVRYAARTHENLNQGKRLKLSLEFFDRLMQARPVHDWRIERGQGGNWDDTEIKAITDRIGCALAVSDRTYRGVKRPFRDAMGPLAFVKDLRNRLAHGSISFVECGEGVTVSELRDLTHRTAQYLREVVVSFSTYIEGFEFLLPERRPAAGPR